MSNMLETILAERELRAGRVIPRWRLSLTIWVLWIAGWVGDGLYRTVGWWWAIVPAVVSSIIVGLLIGGYVRRSIR